ncbi:MAG TPA: Ig-like domain-containing protein, partial [Verrucomicrobiae bacterium]|nr:Ig-like domain-containing protein [Verrucomicrobiae bacterium]
GGSSGSAAYVDLPNGLVSNNSANRGGSGQVSLEGWIRITGGRTWSRILDAGSSDIGGGVGGEVTGPGGGGAGLDYLMLSAQVGDDVGTHRIELRNEDPAGGGIATVDHASVAFNTDSHFVLTWDESTGQIKAYENGQEKASMTVDDPMSDLNDVNVWLGRSNWTGDQNMQGEFDEFRVYDRVLTAEDVSNNYNVGPDNDYGSVAAIHFAAQRSTMMKDETQSTSIIVDFANALGVNLNGSPCVAYLSSNPAVLTVDAQGVITAVASGVANVTARIAGEAASITITVESLNEAPVANDDVFSTNEDTPLIMPAPGVLANDTDADGDPLTASQVAGTAHGILTLNPEGSFSYTPDSNFNGTDSFTYQASDGQEDSNVATVTINVLPVNDAPVCAPATAVANGTEPVAITLSGSDLEGDALTYHLVTAPANGTVNISGNVATYRSNPGFSGVDSFSFKVNDG